MNENPELVPEESTEVAEAAAEAPAEEPVEAKGSGGSTLWREWVKPLLMVLAVMVCVRSALADWNDVPTGSMKPTIVEGDRIFVNKAAYDLRVPLTRIRLAKWADPARGDIVVLFSPDDGKRLVKRVVGIPGDTVEVQRGRLLINGEALPYQPAAEDVAVDLDPHDRVGARFESETLGAATHPIMLLPGVPFLDNYGPIVVPEGRYFVMGDNRSQSRDSRFFGFVERGAIVGKAVTVVFSLDHHRRLLPSFRLDRFFHSLG
ncbi:MAG TPA: signal peptidase I [Thermoanaerobaculia bacterium]|nr:signal peptidase I [Thermoanaerobaculia bacterium]